MTGLGLDSCGPRTMNQDEGDTSINSRLLGMLVVSRFASVSRVPGFPAKQTPNGRHW